MSAHVIDTAVCHRVMATFRTEDVSAKGLGKGMGFAHLSPWEKRERVRGLARARALELNAGAA